MYYVEGFTVPGGKTLRVDMSRPANGRVFIAIKLGIPGAEHLLGCNTDKYLFASMVAQKRAHSFTDGHYEVRAQPIEVDGRDYYDLTFLFLGREQVTVRVEQDGLLTWLNL